MSRPRLLFIVKQKQGKSLWVDPLNKKSGLSNAVETLVNALDESGIDVHLREAVDKNCLHRLITEVKPSVVIIEAYWVNPGKIQLLKTYFPDVHWIVRNHSEVPFLATEGVSGGWNCEYLKMGVEIGSVSDRTVRDLSPLLGNLGLPKHLLTHLPNIYTNDDLGVVNVKRVPTDEVHIGCFGAIREMKNHYLQAMAAVDYAHKAGKKLFFHINGTRVEGNGSQPLRNLRDMFERLHNCKLIEHPWMNKEQFYDLMKTQIDVVLQCSLTESFNIVAADAVYCSVPVIASSEIKWLRPRSHCDATNAVDISNKLTFLFSSNRYHLQYYVEDQILDLHEYNERSLISWMKRFG